ncbi:MAG: bile acid transporter [Verrucomicrobiota bacterium]
MDTSTIIRLLTTASLGGLLMAVGLRLTWPEIREAIRKSHLGWVLPVNFVLVPALTLAMARLIQAPANLAVGMLLLAAAPFAPVVPTFAKMARGDLALAAGLTAMFPFLSAFLTPLVCAVGLKALPGTASLNFNFFIILVVLLATITLPLATGLAINHYLAAIGRRLLRPVEMVSEAAGAISLAFVTIVEFQTIITTGWKPLVAMAVVSEVSLCAGFALSGPSVGVRRVVALGTSNRNIALALLVAIDSFPGTPIVGTVVANGLLLIFLGLLHVAYWRYFARDGKP